MSATDQQGLDLLGRQLRFEITETLGQCQRAVERRLREARMTDAEQEARRIAREQTPLRRSCGGSKSETWDRLPAEAVEQHATRWRVYLVPVGIEGEPWLACESDEAYFAQRHAMELCEMLDGLHRVPAVVPPTSWADIRDER